MTARNKKSRARFTNLSIPCRRVILVIRPTGYNNYAEFTLNRRPPWRCFCKIEIEELAKHGTMLPPNMMGLTDEQVEELKLKDEWGEKCVPSGGWSFNKDVIGTWNRIKDSGW